MSWVRDLLVALITFDPDPPLDWLSGLATLCCVQVFLLPPLGLVAIGVYGFFYFSSGCGGFFVIALSVSHLVGLPILPTFSLKI